MILGIDYGASKVGLALAGRNEKVSVPLTTLRFTSPDELVEKLAAVVREYGVTSIVVGNPGNREADKGVDSFAAHLESALKLPVAMVDEFMTTQAAQTLLKASRKKGIGEDDAVAAQLILETYLTRGKDA